MEQKKAIIALILGVAIGGTALYGGLVYDSAQKIDFEFESFYLERIGWSGVPLFSEIVSITIRIQGIGTTEGLVPVSIKGGTFNAEIDGVYFGSGVIYEFTASRDGGDVEIGWTLSDFSEAQLNVSLALINGETLPGVFTITSLTFLGFDITTNIAVEEDVSLLDLL